MPGTTDTVKTILTPGEFVIRKEAVDMIGVPMLNMINNMPEKGGHSNIDRLIEMATTENMKGMYGGGMVKAGPKPMGHGGMVDAYRGGGVVMDQYGHGGMVKNKMMMMEKGGQLKPVPKDNPGLGKLPEMVRNRMGYMKEGGMVDNSLMGMRYGGMAKKKKMMGYEDGGKVQDIEEYLDILEKTVGDRQGTAMGEYGERRSELTKGLYNYVQPDSIERFGNLLSTALRMQRGKFAPGTDTYENLRELLYTENLRNPLKKPISEYVTGGKVKQYQDGGEVMLPPQPADPLQIGARQADPSMYEGSTLGAIRNQARMLQNSIEQDTVNKARNSLKLMSIIDSLKQAGAGESLDYMPMNPMPTSKADSMMLRDLMEYYKMQQMKKMSQ
jgi:hypothetical protein